MHSQFFFLRFFLLEPLKSTMGHPFILFRALIGSKTLGFWPMLFWTDFMSKLVSLTSWLISQPILDLHRSVLPFWKPHGGGLVVLGSNGPQNELNENIGPLKLETKQFYNFSAAHHTEMNSTLGNTYLYASSMEQKTFLEWAFFDQIFSKTTLKWPLIKKI